MFLIIDGHMTKSFSDCLRLIDCVVILNSTFFFWSLNTCKAAANELAPSLNNVFFLLLLFKGFLLYDWMSDFGIYLNLEVLLHWFETGTQSLSWSLENVTVNVSSFPSQVAISLAGLIALNFLSLNHLCLILVCSIFSFLIFSISIHFSKFQNYLLLFKKFFRHFMKVNYFHYKFFLILQ